MGWPGLGKEVQDICKEMGLPGATDVKVNMAKEDVKEAITVHHLMNIKKEMKKTGGYVQNRHERKKRLHPVWGGGVPDGLPHGILPV